MCSDTAVIASAKNGNAPGTINVDFGADTDVDVLTLVGRNVTVQNFGIEKGAATKSPTCWAWKAKSSTVNGGLRLPEARSIEMRLGKSHSSGRRRLDAMTFS